MLQEFITLNCGKILIVPDRGFWRLAKGAAETVRFKHPFPGTVVDIEIDTSDTKSYRLTSEVTDSEIF